MAQALHYFKALSDETRLRLLHILMHYELSVNEIVAILRMGQSRVSRHLKILSEAGLLHSRRDGLWVFYTAPEQGEDNNFLQSIRPFLKEDAQMRADLDMAARCIEERARKTRQFFNAIADDWDALSQAVLGDFDLARHICLSLPDKCRVAVDLGCGTGAVLEHLLTHVATVIGVDGSPRMLELCKRRFRAEQIRDNTVSLRIGELDHLPLCDGEADFACMNLVLHHLSTPASALPEIHRILRPNGLVLISDFEKHDQDSMRQEYGDRWLGFTAENLEGMLCTAGFQPESIQRFPISRDLTLLMVAARKPSGTSPP